MHVLDWILWLVPMTILLVLAVIQLLRGFHVDFPFFFSYVAFAVIATVARIIVRNAPVSYFWVYWITDAVLGILALLTLNEVFKHLFGVDYAAHWWFRLILPAAALIIAFLFVR